MTTDEPLAGGATRRGLGVSARLLGAIIVPVVVLGISLSTTVSESRRDAQRAALVSERTMVLRQLVELRSAVFRERLALEIFVPSRRPPPALLETTTFGSQITEDPGQLTERTDAALIALAPADRPFDLAALERARATPVEDSLSGGAIQGAFDEVDEMLARKMTADLTMVRESAIDLADVRLIRAGTRLERSIRLPEEAAFLVAALAEMWAVGPPERPAVQSEVAMALATLESSARRLSDAESEATSEVTQAVERRLERPERLQGVIDSTTSGSLTDPDRPPSEPVDVGLGLLDGVDWLLGVDEIPIQAADAAAVASGQVSSDARTAERQAALLAAVAILGSIVAAVLFGRSIVRPVRRLTDHAERIGSGNLDVDPHQQGPPEIVRATKAMNDVVENLVLLERKSQALARADFADKSLQEPLPGRLGAALRLSMAVLSESIEERESLQSRLEFAASHDSLTGIGNRASLTDVLEQMRDDAAGSSALVAVTFIDLDDFKGINDRHGHSLGDEVLKVIAARMVAVAPSDALVARLGGDEFVIAAPDVANIYEPVEVARQVITVVSEPVEIDGRTVAVSASAGVAVAGGGDGGRPVDPSALLHMADLAVYTAKLDPNDNVAVYDDELDRRLIHQRSIESSMRSALQDGSGELRLVYQPIVSADGGGLHRAEALLRWNKPGIGDVLPDLFIPIAETSDLILQVDQWVIEAALRQLSEWSRDPQHRNLAVGVNVSGRSLLDRSFVGRVAAALSHSGVRPELFSVEVTETALVSDLEMAASQLAALRDLGVRVAIDDFGTGYTSVAHLRALPVDVLKIDRGFIQDLPEQGNRVLIEMITQLAHNLDLAVVAEGVERVEQVEALREIGCDRLQGYFFSPPLSPDGLTDWVGRHVGGPVRS